MSTANAQDTAGTQGTAGAGAADVAANPYELRTDVARLEAAADRWEQVGQALARRGDEVVEAARRATEGWDAASAESYDQHRRQVLANLDRLTGLASSVAGSLRAVVTLATSSQDELDRAWASVALVPHHAEGPDRHLVFSPSEDDDRGKVSRGRVATDDIRRRLTLSLDQESTRLREARAEMVLVRSELATLTGGSFPVGGGSAGDLGPGVGTVPPPATTVLGSAQSGVAALPPLAPAQTVAMPDLGQVPATGLGALGVAGLSARGGRDAASSGGSAPLGGMGAGAMAARAGSTGRTSGAGRAGGAGARSGSPRPSGRGTGTPVDESARTTRTRAGTAGGEGDEGREARAAREAREVREAKDAKRAAVEEKRAERAARRAERRRSADQHDREETPARITVVQHAPGAEPEQPRR